ncbi:TPA: hypothetical protein ACX6NV_000570 [Photobacterium damselae]
MLFDGKDGTSDGTGNGFSKEITGFGGPVSIFVYGSFNGATVTLERYSSVKDDFLPTSAVWNQSDVFQDLKVKLGDRYRLQISGTSGSVSIQAEVS